MGPTGQGHCPGQSQPHPRAPEHLKLPRVLLLRPASPGRPPLSRRGCHLRGETVSRGLRGLGLPERTRCLPGGPGAFGAPRSGHVQCEELPVPGCSVRGPRERLPRVRLDDGSCGCGVAVGHLGHARAGLIGWRGEAAGQTRGEGTGRAAGGRPGWRPGSTAASAHPEPGRGASGALGGKQA